MATFFFDLHECGFETPDHEGREAEDEKGAERYALKAARELMCAELSEGSLCLGCHIDILDAQRSFVKRIAFRDAVRITGT